MPYERHFQVWSMPKLRLEQKNFGSPLHNHLLGDLETIRAILSNYSDEKDKIQEARDILRLGDRHDFGNRKIKNQEKG